MKHYFLACLIISASTIIPINAQSEEVAIDAAVLYRDYCSVCHGEKGDGKSHAMQGLNPPPRDFTSPISSIELSKERIAHAVREGVPNTAMTAWKTRLNEEQIDAIAIYVRDKFLRAASVENATEGSRIYADYCSVCHGDTGKGAFWATTGLSPHPADFTNPLVQKKLHRERMIKSVAYGRAETAMTGWKDRLTNQQIEVVVDYVINSFMSDKNKMAKISKANTLASTVADMSFPMPNRLKGDFNKGATLYLSNCTACHGETGDGRGPRAYFINPKPRNFLHTSSRATFNRPNLFAGISKGKLFSEMPAWDKVMTPQEIADVSEYVFKTFIEKNKPGGY